MARKNKQQRLDRTITILQHKWGQETIHKGAKVARIASIKTGFPELDEAVGVGGIPRGRITILNGAPTSGKVTLAALVLARAQTRSQPVAYIDIAHTCDADYLERCGVHLKDLLVVRPQDGYQALDLALSLAERSDLAAILLDHWGLVNTDSRIRRYAAGTLDHLANRLARKTAFLVLDEQQPLWRRLLPGTENALAHYATLQLTLKRERWLLQGADIRGYRANVSIEKNKVGPSGKVVPIEIHFNGVVRGRGI